MNIKKIEVGDLKTNCYLLEKDNNLLIIDPGADYPKIKKEIKDNNVVGILITHSHFDHTGCIKNLINDYNALVFDNNSLKEEVKNISTFNFKVIKTYGHTMDSLSFYFEKEKIIFTGDFLFYDTIGRCDFKESNYQEMIKSINKIKNYPNDITIYPGHGIPTNLGREKQYNPYFN